MGVELMQRLRLPKDGSRKLKQLVADLSFSKQMLQDLLRKKTEAHSYAAPLPISTGFVLGQRTPFVHSARGLLADVGM